MDPGALLTWRRGEEGEEERRREGEKRDREGGLGRTERVRVVVVRVFLSDNLRNGPIEWSNSHQLVKVQSNGQTRVSLSDSLQGLCGT